jgi:hypothetical protein
MFFHSSTLKSVYGLFIFCIAKLNIAFYFGYFFTSICPFCLFYSDLLLLLRHFHVFKMKNPAPKSGKTIMKNLPILELMSHRLDCKGRKKIEYTSFFRKLCGYLLLILQRFLSTNIKHKHRNI